MSDSTKTVKGMLGASHSFSEEEKQAFSEHINHCLAHDPKCAHLLPLDVESMDLFEKCSDGLILCKLINLAMYDAIDERSINSQPNMNIYKKTENQNLALNASRAIGCQVINIGAQDLIEGRPHLLLGIVWQIIRIQLLSQISLKNIPELVLLLEEGEEMLDFMKLPPELILLRWLNYHLGKANSTRTAKNFGSDLQDSEIYLTVLNRLDSVACPVFMSDDLETRAEKVIDYSIAIGGSPFIKAHDIVHGNKKLNIAMVALLFNTKHGLIMNETRRKSIDFSQITIDDAGDSREERVFRMWINSLNIEGMYVHDLFSESQDGVNLIRVIESIKPDAVNWRKANREVPNRYKKVENANYVIELCKSFNFSMVNVGGLDIVDGNKKMILAIIQQLMRKNTIQVLENLAASHGFTDISDNQIKDWANNKVAASGKRSQMRNFKDTSLKTSIFLLELIAAIEPRAVDWDLVQSGANYEEQVMNAKYALSNARKIGACVFLTPEDIVEVKSKMIVIFVASLWQADLSRSDAAEETA